MRGADWRRLTVLIQERPGLLLHPPELWREIAETLLRELVVSEHESWFVRQEAMSRLLEHPASAGHAIAACTDMADDASNPVFIEPISLLDATDCPAANRYVLRELCAPRNDQSLQGALLAATSKHRRGHYSLAERATLTKAVADLLQDRAAHPEVGPLVVDLLALLDAGRPRAQGAAMGIASSLAMDAQRRLAVAAAGPDQVLAELIDEALFSHNADGRLYAAALVGATPYREPLAQAVIDRLCKTAAIRDDIFVERGLRLLARLRVTAHYSLVQRLLQDAAATPRTRHSAAWSLSHTAVRVEEPVWRKIADLQLHLFKTRPSSLDADILRGLVYSIGAAAHPRLMAEFAAHPSLPHHIRQLAGWWNERGGALLDSVGAYEELPASATRLDGRADTARRSHRSHSFRCGGLRLLDSGWWSLERPKLSIH
jgi:hypothetical protein